MTAFGVDRLLLSNRLDATCARIQSLSMAHRQNIISDEEYSSVHEQLLREKSEVEQDLRFALKVDMICSSVWAVTKAAIVIYVLYMVFT